ncbi:hypothetical protein ACN27E_07900 [Mycobacterium sp. WMMD1722]|uniref:hypothetical protein n=1 Tax=Mycobacterium sp. WMMD1722 TaxID=3404117 RepID=UPI003BF48177
MALTFTDDQATALLDLLGLPSDTTDIDTILATVKDAVGQPIDDAKPSAVAAAAKRVGLEVVDTDTLTALRHDAAEGRQIKAAAARQAVEDAVDKAIGKGKITFSRRKHWVDLIAADPGMADVLASVPDETAVPLTEIGHGVEASAPHSETAEWFR